MHACCKHDGQDLAAHSPKACSLACFHEAAWQKLAHDGSDGLIDIYHHQLAGCVSRHVRFWKHSPPCSFMHRQRSRAAMLVSVCRVSLWRMRAESFTRSVLSATKASHVTFQARDRVDVQANPKVALLAGCRGRGVTGTIVIDDGTRRHGLGRRRP